MLDYEEEDKWLAKQRAKMGQYQNPPDGCTNCGRNRVMVGDDGKHRCEKCCWCTEDSAYDAEFLEYMR
jgi:ribosomal protein L37AE/L43A